MMGVRGVWNDEIDIPIIAHSIEGEKIPTTRIGWRPFNIFDIPPSYYDRMDRDHVRVFLVTQEAVLTEVDYCWREAAEDFESRTLRYVAGPFSLVCLIHSRNFKTDSISSL